MAKETIIKISDDLDGSDASSTVPFTWNSVAYEIDLSTRNTWEFEKAVAPYVAAARRVAATTRKSRGKKAANTPALSMDEIRSWAKDNGHKVADRGRIPAAVLDAFHAAKKAVTDTVAPPTAPAAPTPAKKTPAKQPPSHEGSSHEGSSHEGSSQEGSSYEGGSQEGGERCEAERGRDPVVGEGQRPQGRRPWPHPR